jgi:endoglucanase
LLGLVLSLTSFHVFPADGCVNNWPLWEGFAKAYIQEDGRVIDHNAEAVSTSEGQSYALFFAVAANDRDRFERILEWTTDNLAQGDMKTHLPAWKWGKSAEGAWKVLDSNSASDADMWIAYALFHAAGLWRKPQYSELARAMLHNIARREVADLPGLGSMLLPAPYGFALDASTWRLNPSYLPVQLLRYFSMVDKGGPWRELVGNTRRMIAETSSGGLVPDWVLYSVGRGFYPDEGKGEYSSYEAIRVYLWWAMLNPRDSMHSELKHILSGIPAFSPDNEYLPERIHVKSGAEEGAAPSGFAGALAPYRFVQFGRRTAIPDSAMGRETGYYNYVLSLFGYGWLEKRFWFNLDGSLTSGSTRKCSK